MRSRLRIGFFKRKKVMLVKVQLDKNDAKSLRPEAPVLRILLMSEQAELASLVSSVDMRSPDMLGQRRYYLRDGGLAGPCGSCQKNFYQTRSYKMRRPFPWRYCTIDLYKKQVTLKYPTAFAVVRDMVRCFWGGVNPGEIDNPGRILEAHQFTELHNDPGGIGDELQGPLCQIVTAVQSDPMQGLSQDQAKMPRPASSMNSRSGRSPSPPTSPQHKSNVDGEGWSEGTFIDSYRSREDVPSAGNGTEGHEVESDVDCVSFRYSRIQGLPAFTWMESEEALVAYLARNQRSVFEGGLEESYYATT